MYDEDMGGGLVGGGLTGGTLAVTGSNSWMLMLLAAGLVSVGLLLYRFAGHKKPHE